MSQRMAKDKTSSGKTTRKATAKSARGKAAADKTSSVKSRGGKSSGPKTSGGKASGRKASARKTLRHVEMLLEMGPVQREAFLARKAPGELADLVESSYCGDLVNVLLDLRKNVVRRIFENVASVRKRVLPELVTLYYYKEYLTNPLPLKVATEDGDVPNYYAILGVPRKASEDDIKYAGRLLLKAYSDECFSTPFREVARERAGEIGDAVKHLKSPQLREAADRLLPSINYLYPRPEQSWFDSALRIID